MRVVSEGEVEIRRMPQRRQSNGATKAAARPKHEDIAVRAYQIYLERGCQHGYDVDDWMQAEYELMQLPVRVLAEMDPPKPRENRPKRKSVIEVVKQAMLV